MARNQGAMEGMNRLMFAWTDSREMVLKALERSTVSTYCGGVDVGEEARMRLLMTCVVCVQASGRPTPFWRGRRVELMMGWRSC